MFIFHIISTKTLKLRGLVAEISLFTTAIDYISPKSYAEIASSLLSNYFYLGGNRVTVVTDNEILLNKEGVMRWYKVALKVASFLSFFPLTLPLFAVHFALQDRHRSTIQNATIQGASAYLTNTSFLEPQVLETLGFQNEFPIMIYLFKKDLENRPFYHLNQLCQAVETNAQSFEDPRMMVYHLRGELTSDLSSFNSLSEVSDTGGVSRDYLHSLTKALVSKLSAASTTSYLPVASLWSTELETIFEDLGTLMMYCHNSREQVKIDGGILFISRLTGQHFDPALFSLALCLTADEIDAPELSFEAKIRMCQALVQSRIDAGDNLDWLMERLREVNEDFPNIDQESTRNEWLTSLGVESDELSQNGDIDQREIFIEKAMSLVVQKSTRIDIEKVYRPIVAIAKGMKKLCLAGEGISSEDKNLYWDQGIRTIPYQTFSDKVQGCPITPESRRSIADRIMYSGDNAKIQRDVERLQALIVDPETSTKIVRLFLRFATGATALLDGQIITVSSQDLYPSIVPKASTCTLTLTFSTRYPDEIVEEQLHQEEDEKTQTFITYLIEEMKRVVDEFDSN